MQNRRTVDIEALLADADWIRRLARSLTRDPDEAADLAQEAWVTAIGAQPGKGRSWLRAVLTNLLWNRRRDDARRKQREHDAARPEAGGEGGSELERMELQAQLARAILELDEPYRSAVVLRHMDGLTPAAIAARQGVSVVAARQRISRGLALLRERLDREVGREGWLPSLVVLAGVQQTINVGPRIALVFAAAAAVVVFTGLALAPTPKRSSAAVVPVARGPQLAVVHASPIAFLEPREPAAVVQASERAPTPVIAGRVVGAEGEPLEGARVQSFRIPPPDGGRMSLTLGELEHPVVAEAVTDAGGRFSLDAKSGAPFVLRASADQRATVQLPHVRLGDEPRIVLPPAATLEGRVVAAEDGEPLAGARVHVLEPVIGNHLVREVRCDAEGRFVVGQLLAGTYKVRAGAAGRVTPMDGVLVETRAGETARVSLGLEAGVTVHGRVFDARTGSPIAGCRVTSTGMFGQETSTDVDGRYTLSGLASGTMERGSIRAEAEGFGAWERVYTSMPPEGYELDFELEPGRIARGRLVRADGTPLEGGVVFAIATSGGRSGRDSIAAESDAGGSFVLRDLRPDLRHALQIRAPGFARALMRFPANELSSPVVELGDVVVQKAAHLSGRVLDENDQPLVGFDVTHALEDDWLAAEAVPPHMRESRFITNAEGRFSFPNVAPGVLWLSASKHGSVDNDRLRFEVCPGERIDDIDLRVRMAGSISGRVLDAAGLPAIQVIVELYPAGSKLQEWDREFSKYTLTDAEGRFSFHGLTAPEYGLHAGGGTLILLRQGAAPSGRSPSVTAALGTDDLTLVLEEVGTIRGVVLDAAGQPCVRWMVAHRRSDTEKPGWSSFVYTNWNGEFEMKVGRGTSHSILVWRSGFSSQSVQVDDVAEGTHDVRLQFPE